MAKWLAAFMDEGLAEGKCQRRRFYKSLAKVSHNDTDLPKTALSEIPKQVTRRLTLSWTILQYYTKIFTSHLAALPGWTGYINYRAASNSWQQEYPITLTDYSTTLGSKKDRSGDLS
jgi:uncharacterized protein YbcC (UPF0753/DUF2309 family)